MEKFNTRIKLFQNIILEINKFSNDCKIILFNFNQKIKSFITNFTEVDEKNNKMELLDECDLLLSNCLKVFLQFFNLNYSYLESESLYLNNEILIKVNKVITDNNIIELGTKIKNKRTELNQLIVNLKNIKRIYKEKMKNAEKAIYNNEVAKKIQINEINIYSHNEEDTIKKAKEAEKNYHENIKKIKNAKIEYLNILNIYSNQIQNFNYFENELFTDLMKKFEIRYKDCLNNIKNALDFFNKNKKIIESTNLVFSKEIKLDNELNNNYEFEYYEPNLFETSINFKDSININVINKLKDEFGLKQLNDFNIESEKNKNEFEIIFRNLIQNCENFTKTDINKLKKFLNEDNYRYEFLMELNKYRGQSNLFDKTISFNIICDIFNYIFSMMDLKNSNEHNNIKYAILLSQSFYIYKNKKKIFIDNELTNNILLSNENFWIDFIEKEIEIEQIKNSNNDIAFIIFTTNINNIKNFVKDSEKLEIILFIFKEKYNFQKEQIKVAEELLKISLDEKKELFFKKKIKKDN